MTAFTVSRGRSVNEFPFAECGTVRTAGKTTRFKDHFDKTALRRIEAHCPDIFSCFHRIPPMNPMMATGIVTQL
jgi:hypothetical protein